MSRLYAAALVSLSIATLGSTALAQVPAHATLINPVTLAPDIEIVHTGDVVHAFSGTINLTDLYYGRSADGGRTWQQVEQVIADFTPQAVSTFGNELLVAGPGVNGPMVMRSADLGLTWSPRVQLSNWTVPYWNQVALHRDGQTVLVIWNDGQQGQLHVRRSIDGGVTWGTDQLIDPLVSLPSSNVFPFDLRVVDDGQTIDVFWSPRTLASLPIAHRIVSSTDGGIT